MAFIIVGMLFALLGLTPGRRSQKSDYAYVWAGLVGAVVALTVVMWRDPTGRPGARPLEPETASLQENTAANGLITGAASTSTRTRAQPNRAAHRGGPR